MLSSDSETENDATKQDIPDKKYSSDSSSYEDEEQMEENKTENKDVVDLPKDDQDAMAVNTEPPLPRRKRFVPKYEIEGVFRVTLNEETQLNVECVIGVDVYAQYPWKLIKLSKILENIELYGDSSDFLPCKELLATYPQEDVLIGYIVDESSDIDEFYVCCTEEARDHCKQQSDRFIKRQEKKLEKAVQKKPRPWTCLGSDYEIKSLEIINSRALMEIEVKTTFPTIYQPKHFDIRDTNCVRDGFIELTPYRQKFNIVLRKRVDCNIQVSPAKFDNVAQTVLRYPKNMWTQSIADALSKIGPDFDAGGDTGDKNLDDEDFSDSDDENPRRAREEIDEVGLQSYRAAMKRMKRMSYIKLINSYVYSHEQELVDIIELNTVMDMYCNDYPNLVVENVINMYNTRHFEEYVCFTDVRAKDKYVSSAVFHPFWSGIVAISYADGSPAAFKLLGPRPDPIQRAVYGLNPVMIWSHIDSLIPKLYLKSPREVKTLSFCPFNENILVGGCINGQLIIWDLTHKLEKVETLEVLSDTREKYKIAMHAHMTWMKQVSDKAVVPATALSNLMTSHYGQITDITWFSPNYTISTTGKITLLEKDQPSSLICATISEDGTVLIWNLSIHNVTQIEGKKIKKSKRVPIKPEGLSQDVSPLGVLDRVLQPSFKISLGIAGVPQIFPALSFTGYKLGIEYVFNPEKKGTGRKYFDCKINKETEQSFDRSLYLGSTHGEFIKVNWTGHDFNTGEVVNSAFCDLKFSCRIHDGVITAVHRNPELNKFTLSVGGKIFAIWSDDVVGRPLIWKKRPCRLTDGKWSLYKPSIIFISTSEGSLETWDLLLRSDEPIAVQTLSGSTLTGVSLHTLPLIKNMIGVSDVNGSFKLFLNPPIFMAQHPSYTSRTEVTLNRELKVFQSFMKWQDTWMNNNPEIFLERKRRERALLEEREEAKKREKEEEEEKLELEAERRRIEKARVIGPAEKWQMIIQKLIEKTIAVKKQINRAELYEQERPLRELEAQRLEKERRMLEIMRNQKTIFNDTVAILFPEAFKKDVPVRKSVFYESKEKIKKDYLEDYVYIETDSIRVVESHPHHHDFSWDATLAEGKERREALNGDSAVLKYHSMRGLLDDDDISYGNENEDDDTKQSSNFIDEQNEDID